MFLISPSCRRHPFDDEMLTAAQDPPACCRHSRRVTHDPDEYADSAASRPVRRSGLLTIPGDTSSVVVHQGVGGPRQAVTAGMHQLANLLHVETFNANGVGGVLSFCNLNFNPTLSAMGCLWRSDSSSADRDRSIACGPAVLSNVQIQRHGRLDRILEHLLIQHWQRAGGHTPDRYACSEPRTLLTPP